MSKGIKKDKSSSIQRLKDKPTGVVKIMHPEEKASAKDKGPPSTNEGLQYILLFL